jgi:hypothetical protein
MTTQVYNDDGSMTLVLNDGSTSTVSAEQMFTLEQIEREYVAPPALRPHELAELFPDAKKYLTQKRKEINEELKALLVDDQNIPTLYPLLKQEPEREFRQWSNEKQRERLLAKRDYNDSILMFMGTKGKQKALEYQTALAKAKTYPIDQLVEVKHGSKALCVWHDEHNPSMHYYRKNNTVFCFSCNKGGDAIDVVRAMKNCSMVEALAFLNNETA